MFAIETYFIGPTNSRGSRIAARVMERGTGMADGRRPRRLTLHWDHALNAQANHMAAARALAAKLGWDGEWIEGGADDGASVWINARRGWDRFTLEVSTP